MEGSGKTCPTERRIFPSGHFKVASLRRLGGLSAPPGATCAIKGEGDGRRGTRVLRANPGRQHGAPSRVQAGSGAPKAAPHARGLHGGMPAQGRCRNRLRTHSRGTGAPVSEAVLDLWVAFPGHTCPIYLDVTIRCPLAQRYSTAWKTPGVAATYAVRQKEARYGPKVITIALESYGRLAVETVAALESLACTAGHGLRDRWAAPRLVPLWRATLQRAVMYATADVDLLALGAAAVSTCALRGCA